MAEGGSFYEDFEVGRTRRHPQGRTLTDVDNIWFTLLTCNTNQIHFNSDYARRHFAKEPFDGRLVVNSFLTLATVVGLSVDETSRNGIMLAMKDMRVVHPVFAGDTIYAETTVLSKRESKSHRGMGIVEVRTAGLNQDGTKVLEFERTFMVRRRGGDWE
ncbi:MAG: MaoC family dehydratase [Nitrososphaerota archaeon]|nr:MaoC family dehydratase [Nitrososphaerota archaeon]MDG6938937.1 MaoC family dehydratase [Nitrososphaerota archaeon]